MTTASGTASATSSSLTSPTLPSTMNSTSGALVTAALPASASPAVHVASVRTHVPVTLDLAASNFTKWRMLVRVLFSKYDLLPHVNAITAAADRTPDWTRDDYVVRSWLYGSISDEILDIIMAEDQTAQEAWTLITNLFLDNQMTRAVYLEAEFRGLVQGDLSITAYCHRLKALSDALSDVGTPVSDQTLVLNCLRGLNPRFSDITTIVTMQSPLPSFAQTRSLLTLRETQLANSTAVGNQTALYSGGPSHGAGSSNSSGQHHDGSDRGDGNRGGGNSSGGRNGGNWRKKKGNGGYNASGNSGGQRSNTHASSVGPWVCFNPYTGQQLQASPVLRQNTGAGLLGARPPALAPAQAFTSLAPLHGQAFGTNPPPVPGYGGTPSVPGHGGAPSWDCTALMAALNNAATPSTVGEWVMHSGATSHMASDPGPSHQGRDSSLQ
ncbi:uncharacterized protein [Triticum aestivum]|uniref:uncharacterized protein n=1 Tax=Triticum aestivum TaxID=4565 RepID=UPI001D030868|nr:uncharacterized protein LOC123172609 [Triticum aestivum]